MDRVEVAQRILDRFNAKTYLEIGSQEGFSFFQIQANRKIAVDPEFKIPMAKRIKKTLAKKIRMEEERYFEVTSDAFFTNAPAVFRKDKIDVALVDGLHTYQQSLRDVLNCLNYLSENGVIVMHDCNPRSEAVAYPGNSLQDAEKMNLPDWDGSWCGDVWKAIVYLRSLRNDLNVFVLDCDYGIGVVTKGKPENVLSYSAEEINRMSYHDLESNRADFLNLKDENYIKEFLLKSDAR